MVSLQTLRNKGGIIVAIIIGLALVAFILGDLFTSGSTLFGDRQDRIGEINGENVSYQEFSNNLQYLTEVHQATSGGASQVEDSQLRDQTWEQLIRKYALKPSLEKSGISITEDEMVQLISGNYVSPLISQQPMFQNQETGSFDPAMISQFIQNLSYDQSGIAQLYWSQLQTEVSDMSQLMKFKNLIEKGTYVTSFEAEKTAEIESVSYDVQFIVKLYSSVADSTIQITEGEIKDYYKANPSFFQTQTQRVMEYVSFQALPTESDYAAAEKYINELAVEFAGNNDALQFATLNTQIPVDTRYYNKEEVPSQLREFASNSDGINLYGPELLGEQYVLSRISDKKILPDSVDFSYIFIDIKETLKADSLLGILKNGASFAEVAREHSLDRSSSDKGGEIGMIDPQTIPEVLSKEILKAKRGEIIKVEVPNQGISIIKINSTKGETEKIQLATIKYTIEPSENTRNEVFGKANVFATSAIEKGFDNQVAEQSLIKRTASIGTNDRNVQGLENSRELIRWAFDAKENDISKVENFGDDYVVAILVNSVEEGTLPLRADVKSRIKTELIKQKKATLFAAEMQGASSIDQLATKLSLDIKEATGVSPVRYIVPEVGRDIAFTGGIYGMDPAKISKPIVGEMGVYVIKVTNQSTLPTDPQIIKSRIEAENQQRAFNTTYQAVLEMSAIKDMRHKFY